MKKEGTRLNNWDGGDVKHGRRELQAKLKLHEGRVARRVSITKHHGLSPPRLEVISERLGLDSFEKKMILLLIGKIVSPVVKTLMETLDGGASRSVDDVVTVGQALGILLASLLSLIVLLSFEFSLPLMLSLTPSLQLTLPLTLPQLSQLLPLTLLSLLSLLSLPL